jgi:long-chain-fatty-acid--[acyl-carrier-protein] ligase
VIGPLVFGVTCHVIEPAVRTIPRWLAKISETRATVTAGPDFCFRLAARMADPASLDLSSLRYVANGGEPVRRSSIMEFEERFSVPGVICPGYGLAEATLSVSVHRPGERYAVDERGNVSCGRALPGLELRAGRGLDAPDEVLIRGDVVFAGYLDAPDDTAQPLQHDGWLHTGDSGYLDDEGRLFVLGRREGMIKRGGATVAPRELEEAAQQADGVRVAAAVGVPVPDREDEITIVVEADLGNHSADSIAAEVARQVVASAGFAPGRVAAVAPRTIPRTPNGKIRHEELRSALVDGIIG